MKFARALASVCLAAGLFVASFCPQMAAQAQAESVKISAPSHTSARGERAAVPSCCLNDNSAAAANKSAVSQKSLNVAAPLISVRLLSDNFEAVDQPRKKSRQTLDHQKFEIRSSVERE